VRSTSSPITNGNSLRDGRKVRVTGKIEIDAVTTAFRGPVIDIANGLVHRAEGLLRSGAGRILGSAVDQHRDVIGCKSSPSARRSQSANASALPSAPGTSPRWG
jgi:hypothetical protein